VTSPFGNTTCPHCRTKLVGSHRRIYWLWLILGGFAAIAPFEIPGFIRYGPAGAIVGTMIGAPLLFAFDRFLDSKFLVFSVREDQIPDEAGGGDVQQS